MNRNLVSRAVSSLPALALSLALSTPGHAAGKIHLEAENAQQNGTEVSQERSGFSGTGYVTGIDGDNDGISWTINNATAGLYNVIIRYAADEEKGYGLNVNGASMAGMFAPSQGFASLAAGKVELKQGRNRIAIERGWGWYDIDYIELIPATTPPKPRKPPLTLVDPKADARTRALMKLLVDNYGQKMLSGQYDIPENKFLRDTTGQTPAIFGSDFIEYSPTRLAHGSKPSPTTEEIIRNVKAGQILTMSWHWNAPTDLIDGNYKGKDGKMIEAPWWRGFDADATTFDIQATMLQPGSEKYKLLLRDIDAIAVQLKKLQDAGVPVLWRPLHEADGTWFWWGAHGPGPFKQLWRLMYDRLTVKHQLHNLIWVYTGSPEKTDWYPGDKYVDIFGVDVYPDDRNDTLSGSWETLLKRFDGKKLLALTEFKGVPNVEKMNRYGVQWSYFVSWTGDLGPTAQNKEEIQRSYKSPLTLNLADLKK